MNAFLKFLFVYYCLIVSIYGAEEELLEFKKTKSLIKPNDSPLEGYLWIGKNRYNVQTSSTVSLRNINVVTMYACNDTNVSRVPLFSMWILQKCPTTMSYPLIASSKAMLKRPRLFVVLKDDYDTLQYRDEFRMNPLAGIVFIQKLQDFDTLLYKYRHSGKINILSPSTLQDVDKEEERYILDFSQRLEFVLAFPVLTSTPIWILSSVLWLLHLRQASFRRGYSPSILHYILLIIPMLKTFQNLSLGIGLFKGLTNPVLSAKLKFISSIFDANIFSLMSLLPIHSLKMAGLRPEMRTFWTPASFKNFLLYLFVCIASNLDAIKNFPSLFAPSLLIIYLLYIKDAIKRAHEILQEHSEDNSEENILMRESVQQRITRRVRGLELIQKMRNSLLIILICRIMAYISSVVLYNIIGKTAVRLVGDVWSFSVLTATLQLKSATSVHIPSRANREQNRSTNIPPINKAIISNNCEIDPHSYHVVEKNKTYDHGYCLPSAIVVLNPSNCYCSKKIHKIKETKIIRSTLNVPIPCKGDLFDEKNKEYTLLKKHQIENVIKYSLIDRTVSNNSEYDTEIDIDEQYPFKSLSIGVPIGKFVLLPKEKLTETEIEKLGDTDNDITQPLIMNGRESTSQNNRFWRIFRALL